LYNTPSNVALLCKNANPKPEGFADCPNPAFEFGKMSGSPRTPGFCKPGFQSLVNTHPVIHSTSSNQQEINDKQIKITKTMLIKYSINTPGPK